MKDPIYLAGCIIRDDADRILLLHRNSPIRQQWEVPGGKIEAGETATQAAAREAKEELGVEIEIKKLIGGRDFEDNGTLFHYSWYEAEIIAGKPSVMEPDLFDEVRYFPFNYLQSHQNLLSINVRNFLKHPRDSKMINHMDYNQKTLRTYEDSKQEYINKTPDKASPHVVEWINRVLAGLKKDGLILEIGSAFGRDADYIESKGYEVQRTDATKAFVTLLQSQGHKAKVLNVLTDELGGPHDLIIANAVFLHFKPAELKHVLHKIHDSLKPGGILAFTVKEGTGSEWSEKYMNGPRFFRYWQAEALRKLVEQAGYENIALTKGKSRNADWLHVIAHK